jgi:hypothetical protein
VEQNMFIIPKHTNWPFAFCGADFAQSIVLFCVLSILIFSVFVFLAIILYVLDRFTAYNYFYDMS